MIKNPKQGFAMLLALWFKDDLKSYSQDTLLANDSKISAYLDTNYVKRILNVNQADMRDFISRIWSLLFFEE